MFFNRPIDDSNIVPELDSASTVLHKEYFSEEVQFSKMFGSLFSRSITAPLECNDDKKCDDVVLINQIRLVFQEDPNLLKIRRYWEKPKKSVAPTVRSNMTPPFTPWEEKLKLNFSVIAASDSELDFYERDYKRDKKERTLRNYFKNLKLFVLIDTLSKHEYTYIKTVKYVGLVFPDSGIPDPFAQLPAQLVKIQKRISSAPRFTNHMEVTSAENEYKILTLLHRHSNYTFRVRSIAPFCKDYFFQDRMPGHNLHEYYEKVEKNAMAGDPKENTIKKLRLTLNLLHILQALHKLNVLHRDIKFGNIMRNDEAVAFVDFGQSAFMDASREVKDFFITAGTVGHVPPEVFKRGAYSEASDIYAMGVVLRELWWNLTPHFISHALFRKVDTIIWKHMVDDIHHRENVECLNIVISKLQSILTSFIQSPKLNKLFKNDKDNNKRIIIENPILDSEVKSTAVATPVVSAASSENKTLSESSTISKSQSTSSKKGKAHPKSSPSCGFSLFACCTQDTMTVTKPEVKNGLK